MRFTAQGGAIIFGRSDATLEARMAVENRHRGNLSAGGTAAGGPEESLAVGHAGGDLLIVLFVRLAPGVVLDEGLRKRISDRLRSHASPRHVPARIVSVTDIPRTKSGKIVELAVRDVIHGRVVSNREALANPGVADLYRDLPDLAR